jgi:hypothetical protein
MRNVLGIAEIVTGGPPRRYGAIGGEFGVLELFIINLQLVEVCFNEAKDKKIEEVCVAAVIANQDGTGKYRSA